MTFTQPPHRGLRRYHLFLVAVGAVLLGMQSWQVSFSEQVRQQMQDRTGVKIQVMYGIIASALLPSLGMVLMYLLLALGRLRLQSQKSHTICRVFFGLILIAGLLYRPSSNINNVHELVMRGSQRLDAYYTGYTFSELYYCTDWRIVLDEKNLSTCRKNLSIDMISFVAAGLVALELLRARKVGDIGRGEKREENDLDHS
ncbi:hypothetical protein CPC16_007377 [Podila verticillata]|nr:hypothetical protein CPC16_007377 [Podila verticillata]